MHKDYFCNDQKVILSLREFRFLLEYYRLSEENPLLIYLIEEPSIYPPELTSLVIVGTHKYLYNTDEYEEVFSVLPNKLINQKALFHNESCISLYEEKAKEVLLYLQECYLRDEEEKFNNPIEEEEEEPEIIETFDFTL